MGIRSMDYLWGWKYGCSKQIICCRIFHTILNVVGLWWDSAEIAWRTLSMLGKCSTRVILLAPHFKPSNPDVSTQNIKLKTENKEVVKYLFVMFQINTWHTKTIRKNLKVNIDIQSLFSRAQDGAPPFRPVHNSIVWRFGFCEFSGNNSAKVESSINCKTFLVNQLLIIWIIFTLGNNTTKHQGLGGCVVF